MFRATFVIVATATAFSLQAPHAMAAGTLNAQALSRGKAPAPATAGGQFDDHTLTRQPNRAKQGFQPERERLTRSESPITGQHAPLTGIQATHARNAGPAPIRHGNDARLDSMHSVTAKSSRASQLSIAQAPLSRSAPQDAQMPAQAANIHAHARTMLPQAPRMEAAPGTRLTRASFEDWLFGR